VTKVASRPYAWPFDGGFSPGDTALLVIGAQEAAVEEIGRDARLALDRLMPVLDRWRALDGLVVFTRRGVTHEADLPAPVSWRNARRARDRILVRGAAGWPLVLRPTATEPIVDHPGGSAFYATGLDAILRRHGVRNLVFCGFRTEALVHATMRDANDRGFEALLVEDASASDDAALHAGTLSLTTFGNGLFGTVATSGALLDALVEFGRDGG
jgi:nicotinamidase-related amidase